MTDMLQKNKNVANNVVNENSQDLTECWEKGTLEKDRDYYITFFDSFPFIAKFKYHDAMIPYWKFEAHGRQYCDENGYDCVKVLAPVPSYEVYKDLIDGRKLLREYIKDITSENAKLKEYERIVTSYNMKPIDYDIACETVNKLLDDNKRLKHDVGNLGYKIKNQRHEIDNRLKEIEKLKELLKECSIANTALVSIMDWLRKSTIPEQRENCAKLFEKTQELQKRLDEVLK